MSESNLSKALAQIAGQVSRQYLPRGMKIMSCDMHGSYLAHYTVGNDKQSCPVCKAMVPDPNNNSGNGTTATQVEHYIDLRDAGISMI